MNDYARRPARGVTGSNYGRLRVARVAVLRRNWQDDAKARADSQDTFDLDVSTMCFNKCFYDKKTESRSLLAP